MIVAFSWVYIQKSYFFALFILTYDGNPWIYNHKII